MLANLTRTYSPFRLPSSIHVLLLINTTGEEERRRREREWWGLMGVPSSFCGALAAPLLQSGKETPHLQSRPIDCNVNEWNKLRKPWRAPAVGGSSRENVLHRSDTRSGCHPPSQAGHPSRFKKSPLLLWHLSNQDCL